MSRVADGAAGQRPTAPPRRRSGGGRAGLAAQEAWIAPGLALVGLLIVGVFTVELLAGRLPFGSLPGGATPRPTPNPSTVVPANKTQVLGTIVFVKGGNVWAASGTDIRQVTKTGTDSSPAWTADGSWIYLIETRTKQGASYPVQGSPRDFTLFYPVIVRMKPDGTGRQELANSLYRTGPGGRYTYHVWYMQPAPDPNGTRFAIVSDGPNPVARDPVIQLMPAKGGKLTALDLPDTPGLGLGDPTWRPDGGALAYTRYDRSGFDAAHRIAVYEVKTKKVKVLTGPGYSQPAWSPDGRFLAAVRWNGAKRDVVIFDARTGAQVLTVTKDGESWAPVWSPAGDAVAFLTASGLDIDLDMARLTRTGASSFALGDRLPITQDSQLDGTSRPSWFIPPDQLPTPSPAPTSTQLSSSTTAPSASGATP